jgi:hypothetical protein
MATENEITELTDKIIQCGNTWLINAKSTFDAVPYVERTMQLSQELQTTFKNCPTGIPQEKLVAIRFELERANDYISSWAGAAEVNTVSQAVSGSAFLSSAGTQVTGLLAENSMNGNVSIRTWATQHITSLEAFQADATAKAFIVKKLKTLYPGGENVFQDSVVTYLQVKHGIGLSSSAGIAFRNVLEAVLNSRLIQLARNYSGNQSIKKWPDMAHAVARGGPGSPQAIQLAAQQSVYDDLWGTKLTRIAKGYVTPTVSEWEAIYSQLMSFLYTTLALVDFKDGD